MAVSFIPNQPILFSDPLFAGQTCLNNDVREYAQLAQTNDTTCIQWKNEPVTSISDCAMNTELNQISNGDFDTLLTGWQEINISTGVISSVTHWSYTGTGAISAAGVYPIFTTTPITTGNLVMISLAVSNPSTQTWIGVGDSGTNTWNIASIGPNTDGRIVTCLYATAGSDIVIYTNGIQEISNVIVRDINTSYCFIPNSSSFYWSYLESLNGYQQTTGITPGPAQPLLLTGTITTGSTYRISFKVKNLPNDPLYYITLRDSVSGNIIVTADENKEYTFWYTHTTANAQVEIHVSDWDSMLLTTIYDLVIDQFSFDYRTRIIYPDGSCASINYDSSSGINPIQFYDDRIIWCFDWSSLESCDILGAPLNTDCYKVVLDDLESGNSYESYTVINYKATGSHECSVMMVGDNTGYAFDFFFNDPSTTVDFTLRQRVRLLQFNPSYPAKSEEYLYSNGNHIRTYAESGKFRTAWFDYVDEPAHDVIRLQLLSDTLTIDSIEYFCKAEDYEPEWGTNGKYNLAQSRVVLKAVQEKSLFNKSC